MNKPITCPRCKGYGVVFPDDTNRDIDCYLCKGLGEVQVVNKFKGEYRALCSRIIAVY